MPAYSPPNKRIKLEDDEEAALSVLAPDIALKIDADAEDQDQDQDEDDEEHCSICLQPLADRTLIPACSHEFCFECLLVWTEQSRRCPLCTGQVGAYLIHNIRSKYDFQKHFLAPLRTSPRAPPRLARLPGGHRRRENAPRRETHWGRAERREREAADELERAVEKRRWVYRHHLYAMHVASNSYTRYRPFPTPSQFAANQDLITRATIFVRRELRVWDSLDVEFLTTFTISLMKSLDIRSESAVKLLAEFLDMDADYDAENPRANAEHFAHELYSYLRSPFRDLSVYDSVLQYETPPDVPPPREQGSRWHRGRSPSPGPSATRPQHTSRSRPPQTRSPSPDASSARRRWSPSHHDSHPRRRRPSTLGERHTSSSPRRTTTHSPAVHNGTDDVEMLPDENIRTRDVKGKGRARSTSASDQSVLREGDVSSEGRATHAIDEDITRDARYDARAVHSADTAGAPLPAVRVRAAEEKPRERPRIRRDAWTSMQAHLAGSGTDRGAGAATATPLERVRPREELSIKGAAAKSSTGAGSHEASTPGMRPASTNTLPTAAATARGTPAMLSETPPPRGKHAVAPRLTPQEIMARTRARLARLGAAEAAPRDGEHAHAPDVKANLTSQPPSSAHGVGGSVAAAAVGGDGDGDRDASAEAVSNASQLQGPRADGGCSAASEPSIATFAAASPPRGTPPQQAGPAHASTTTAAAALRTQLLHRLQDAKRAQEEEEAEPREGARGPGGPRRAAPSAHGGLQAHTPEGQATQTSIPAVATVDRAASSGAPTPAPTPASVRSHAPPTPALARRDAEMLESRLRAQAQLRLKAAEERRLASAQAADAAQDGAARESVLRARLKRSQ